MSEPDDRDPPSAEELEAAARLRDALDEDPLVGVLRAAWSPPAIAPAAHATLLEDVPSPQELAAAEQLATQLARGDRPDVVEALASAWSPGPIDAAAHDTIVARALEARAPAAVVPLFRRRVVRTIGAGLALAAGVALWWTQATTMDRAEAPLARSRSTQPLFDTPFRAGDATSARIDRIAIARAADYRDNRFAAWGVR